VFIVDDLNTIAAPTRQPIDLRALTLMLGLCVIWGIQQSAMKIIVAEVPPVLQLAIRFGGATVFFAVLVLAKEGGKTFADGTLLSGVLLGVLFSVEFIFAGEALRHTSASHTVIFLYTAPIFTALGLQMLPEERLDRVQWSGIAVAFLGIVIAFLGHGGGGIGEVILGDSLALLGGVSWGLSNVVIRRSCIGSASTAKTVLYQVGLATLILGGYAAMTRQTAVQFTPIAVFSLLFQTLIISIASYLLWFWLLRHYLTSRLALLGLMTPLFGVLFAYLLLADRIELRFALGSLLVLAGVLTVNVPRRAR
jgi:drug/metabolite transporter (DMT)-like permease